MPKKRQYYSTKSWDSKNRREARITFSYSDASHLFELALPNFQTGCGECDSIVTRLKQFLGPKEVSRKKRLVKKYPYNQKEHI